MTLLPRYAAALVGPLLIALLSSACGAAAAPSPAPVTIATTTPIATLVTQTATAGPTIPVEPALQLIWEKASTSPGHAQATYWPVIDPLTGAVWVAAPFDGLYWIFKPDGTFIGSFGSPGSGDGQFNFKRPTCDCGAGAIAFAPDGSFFVADGGNNRIQKFDAGHDFVKAWGSFGSGDGHFADAIGIVTDGKLVYVYDDVRVDIQVFATDGTYVRAMTGDISGWIVVDGAGNLYAASAKGITEYDPTGAEVKTYPLPAFDGVRIGLAMDTSGRFYFNIQSDSTGQSLGLVRFDPATGSLDRWPTGGETLLIDPSQTAIYEANYVSNGWPAGVLRKYALPTP